MSGDTTNVNSWANADVYVAPVGTSSPADIDTEFGAGWDLVGILDGDAGFEHARNWDVTEKFGWGVGIVKTTRRNYSEKVTFTALEENAVTFALVHPGSDDDTLVVPRPERVRLAFEVIDGDVKRRLITSVDGGAEVWVSTLKDSEGDVTMYACEATIYANADSELFERQAAGLASV